MTMLSIGDLAHSFLIRRQTAGLKADLTRLGTELTTGRKADLSQVLAGDYGPYAGIERALRAVAAFETANTEAAGMMAAAQLALENVQDIGRDVTPALLTASSSRDATLIRATSGDARAKFSSVVSTLNTSYADRTLFGGAATDRPALATGDAMMAELKLLVAGETTASGVVAVVDAWFDDPGGGFETMGYLGSATDLAPFQIADGETVAADTRADAAEIRGLLKGYALAGLIAEGALSGDVGEQATLISTAAERMLTSEDDLTDIRARIGTVEARIEDAEARNAAEAAAYDLARTELVGADPYETATRFEAVYSQIETLYTATAKIAALKFTDYVR